MLSFDERMTALMYAAKTNNLELARHLIGIGVDVNKRMERLRLFRRLDASALNFAVEEDHYEMAALLLDNGAKQFARFKGTTPLHSASTLKMAKLLILHGGFIHAVNREQETALHHAAYCGAIDYVKFLISAGLDKNAMSSYGTPLQIAIVNGQMNVVDFLLHIGASFQFSVADDVLLRWLNENIDAADSSETGSRLKVEGLYETVRHYLLTIPCLISEAKDGNVRLFTDMLCRGNHFHPMQVLPTMPPEARTELMRWVAAMRADMHQLFILFHSNHSASRVFFPSPITDTLKQMIFLPKKTRALLHYFYLR